MRDPRRSLRRFLRDRRAATAIIIGLAAPVLVGAAGLGAELAFWEFRQRAIQQQVDAAAYAGAVEWMISDETVQIPDVVTDSLDTNGFNSAIGAHGQQSPPASGPYSDDRAVFVWGTETWPRYFTALFASGTVTLRGEATALVEPLSNACMLALDPTAGGAVTMTGSTNVDLIGCSVMSNSRASDSLNIAGTATLEATCAGAVGGYDIDGTLTLTDCEEPRDQLPPVPDPYADVPEPPIVGACKKPDNFGGPDGAVHNIGPARYCGMTVIRTVNFAPGLYVIDGGSLSIHSTAVLNGTGVTFFLTNGASLLVNAGATLNLSAPTAGPYAGLVFFGDRSGFPVDHTLDGHASSVITGAIYFPNDHLQVNGTSTTATGCTQIIARTIDIAGDADLAINCAGTGVRDIVMAGGVSLVQ